MNALTRTLRSFDPIRAISPKWAYQCEAYRFAYDALVNDRTGGGGRPTSRNPGAADNELDEETLNGLREVARDLAQNNPLVKGILQDEANDVVGTETQIQSRSGNTDWDSETERLWKQEMIDRPCDVSGRFNVKKLLQLAFPASRRDGDFFVLNTKQGYQLCEGEQCGTPHGHQEAKTFTVTNGVAVSKQSGRVIGYFIGKPAEWGAIDPQSWRQYQKPDVFHVFNPDRVSYSRGEPIFASSVVLLKKLWGFVDASVVKARLHVCLSVFVELESQDRIPGAFKKGRYPSGQTPEGQKIDKISPGGISYLNQGETVKPFIPSSPTSEFDPFFLRVLSIIGRPLCMPLILTSLDFSQATNMNMRGAFMQAQKNFKQQQENLVVPLYSWLYTHWLREKIRAGQIQEIEGAFAHEVSPQRWPYVDPAKQAEADAQELANGTTSEIEICTRGGKDYLDVVQNIVKAQEIRREQDVQEKTERDAA